VSNKAGSGGVGAALLLDEAQVLPGAHLNILLRALGTVEQSRVVLFMAALPVLADTLSSMSGSMPDPSWRAMFSASYVRLSSLGALDPASAESVLTDRVGPEDGEFEGKALSTLAGFAIGHPLTLEMLGQSAWDIAANGNPGDGRVVIRESHADEAIAQVSDQLRVLYYRPTWTRCSDSERAMLRELARLGGLAGEQNLVRSAKSGDSDPTATVYNLVGKGVIYEIARTGTVSIVLPGFREFITSA
jgi:hypothetical protein